MLNLSILKNLVKATIRNLIVAFIYIGVLALLIYFPFKNNITTVKSLVNLVSSKNSEVVLKNVKLNLETRRLTTYPSYGTKYAKIKIPTIDVNSPVYYGDSLQVIRNGVGHSSGSYFPGEGASILYMGHLSTDFKNLQKISKGDKIIVETNYGTFTYEVFDYKVIRFDELDKVPIQTEKEMLMVYTCDQLLKIGHTKKRFIVYANLVNSKFKED